MKTAPTACVRCVVLGLLLALVGCRAPDPMRMHVPQTFEPQGFELAQLMDNYKPLIAEKWQLDPIADHPDATVCVSQVTGRIPPHYFKRHHRVICVLNGKGIAVVAGTRYRVSPGATLVVPKGARYEYVPNGSARYFAICTFSPRCSGEDIKFIKEKKKKKKKAAKKPEPHKQAPPEPATDKPQPPAKPEADAKPTDAKPAEKKPAPAPPAQAKPDEKKPAPSKPPMPKPAGTKSTAPKPPAAPDPPAE